MSPLQRAGAALLAATVLALPLSLHARRAAAQQAPAVEAKHRTSPDPLIGAPVGASRRATSEYLVAHGWLRVADSVSTVGHPALFTGTFVGRPAEIIALFGGASENEALTSLVVNVPVRLPSELRAAYADVFRLVEGARCQPSLAREQATQLDSILSGGAPYIPSRSSVPTQAPLLPEHTTASLMNNTDWPDPSWVSRDGTLATRLTAVQASNGARWPYQVTVWTSAATQFDQPTICADTRATLDSIAHARDAGQRPDY